MDKQAYERVVSAVLKKYDAPKNSVTTEGPVWYSDSKIFDIDTGKTEDASNSAEKIEGYDHKKVVLNIMRRLKEFKKHRSDLFDGKSKNPQLVGISRELLRRDGKLYPERYQLFVSGAPKGYNLFMDENKNIIYPEYSYPEEKEENE